MPRDKAELVRRYFDAWNSTEFEPSVEDIDPDIEIDWSASHAPYAGTYSGFDGWQRLYSEMRESFQGGWLEADEYRSIGSHVVVRNTAHLRGRDGIEVTATSTLVFTFRHEKLAHVRLFHDDADALAAIDDAD